MVNRQVYQRSLAKIAWGYVFLYLNINFSVNGHALSILPEWAGYLLIFMALDGVALQEPSAGSLKPFGLLLAAEAAIEWAVTLAGADWSYTWITLLVVVINLYFHFQLLTNLADIARRSGSAYSRRLRVLRTAQTVMLTVSGSLSILPEDWKQELERQPAAAMVLVAAGVIIAVSICVTLFLYNKEQNWDLVLPDHVARLLETLERAGHEAFVVGGCVRDTLMGKAPADWDVCTSALPEETIACFGEKRTIPTGMQHGTVTVLTDGKPVEVTTYRVDGDYLDSRHPSKVTFTRSLEEDLKRRDFTMNAVAYSPSAGPVDVSGGRMDIQARVIRCVGDPQKRFEEDALRILRALRFKAVLGFMLDGETAKAVRRCRDLLTHISKERISAELSKLVLGDYADSVLQGYHEVLAVCAPEIKAVSVKALPGDLAVRLAVLFPSGTKQALRALKYDRMTVKKAGAVAKLLEERPAPPVEKTEILYLLKEQGREVAGLYFAAAEAVGGDERPSRILEEILAGGPCYSLEQLAVSGGDLVRMGMAPGPEIGRLLNEMVDLIIEGRLENSSVSLLDYARERGKL